MSYCDPQDGFGPFPSFPRLKGLTPEAQSFLDPSNFDPKLLDPDFDPMAMTPANPAQKRGREEEADQGPGDLLRAKKTIRSESPMRASPRDPLDIQNNSSEQLGLTRCSDDSKISDIGEDVNPLLGMQSNFSFNSSATPLSLEHAGTHSAQRCSKTPKSNKAKGKERAVYPSDYDAQRIPGHSELASNSLGSPAPGKNYQSTGEQGILSGSQDSSLAVDSNRGQQTSSVEDTGSDSLAVYSPYPTADYDEDSAEYGIFSQDEQISYQREGSSQEGGNNNTSRNSFDKQVATDSSSTDTQDLDLGACEYDQQDSYTWYEVHSLIAEAKWNAERAHAHEEDMIHREATEWAQGQIDEYREECMEHLEQEVQRRGGMMVQAANKTAETLFVQRKSEWEQFDSRKDARIQQLEHLLSLARTNQSLQVPSVPQVDLEMSKNLKDAREIADALNLEKQSFLGKQEALNKSLDKTTEENKSILKKLDDAEAKVKKSTKENELLTTNLDESEATAELLAIQKKNAEEKALALQKEIAETPKIHPETETELNSLKTKVLLLENSNKEIPALTEQLRQSKQKAISLQILADKVSGMTEELKDSKTQIGKLEVAATKHVCPVVEPKVLGAPQKSIYELLSTQIGIEVSEIILHKQRDLSYFHLLKAAKKELAKTKLKLEDSEEYAAALEKDCSTIRDDLRMKTYAAIYNTDNKDIPMNPCAENSVNNMNLQNAITRKNGPGLTELRKLFRRDVVAVATRKSKVPSPRQAAVIASIRELCDTYVPSAKKYSHPEFTHSLGHENKTSPSATTAVDAGTQERDADSSPGLEDLAFEVRSHTIRGDISDQTTLTNDRQPMNSCFKSSTKRSTRKYKKQVAFVPSPTVINTPGVPNPVVPVAISSPRVPKAPTSKPIYPSFNVGHHPLLRPRVILTAIKRMTLILVGIILVSLMIINHIKLCRVNSQVPAPEIIPADSVFTEETVSDTVSISSWGPPAPAPSPYEDESELDLGVLYLRARAVIQTLKLDEEEAERTLHFVSRLQLFPEPTPFPPTTALQHVPVIETEPAEHVKLVSEPHWAYVIACGFIFDTCKCFLGLSVITVLFWLCAEWTRFKEYRRLNGIEVARAKKAHQERCWKE